MYMNHTFSSSTHLLLGVSLHYEKQYPLTIAVLDAAQMDQYQPQGEKRNEQAAQ